MLQQVGLISVLTPLLMGFISFLGQRIETNRYQKNILKPVEYIANIFYMLCFLALFCVVLYSCFSLQLIRGAEYTYVIGGWSKAIGIEMKYNISVALAILSVLIIACVFFATNLYGTINYAFRGFVCIMICGANGIILTNDIFNSYVFFEVVCITSYIIYAHGKEQECIQNTFNYMIISSFTGVILLLIIGFLYKITGNLNIDLIHNVISNYQNNKAINAMFVIFILAMMFKIGLYPLHSVLNNIYNSLETNKLLVVAGISSIVYPIFILKIILNLFGMDVLIANEYLHIVLKLFGGIGFLFFNVMAFITTNAKIFIISLSFAQTSFFALCLPYLNDKTIQSGLLFSVVSNAVLKTCLFAILYKIQSAFKSINIIKKNFNHIQEQLYKSIFAVLLFLISGMPFSLVFMSKWHILNGFISSPHSVIWLIVLLSGFAIDIIACFSFMRDILSRNQDSYTISIPVKNNIPMIFIITFSIIFMILSTTYGHSFNIAKVKPIIALRGSK